MVEIRPNANQTRQCSFGCPPGFCVADTIEEFSLLVSPPREPGQ
jgi:hypothetical protein